MIEIKGYNQKKELIRILMFEEELDIGEAKCPYCGKINTIDYIEENKITKENL